MSMPWPGSCHQQFLQVTTVLATFLSPVAVALLAKTTCSLTNSLSHKVQQGQLPFQLTETRSADASYDFGARWASKLDLAQERTLSQKTHRASQQAAEVHYSLSSEYCSCSFPENPRANSNRGEGGDFVQHIQMELLDSLSPRDHISQTRSTKGNVTVKDHRGLRKPHESQTIQSSYFPQLNSKRTNASVIERNHSESAQKEMEDNSTSFQKCKSGIAVNAVIGHEASKPDEHHLPVKASDEQQPSCKTTDLEPNSEVDGAHLQDLQETAKDKEQHDGSAVISHQTRGEHETKSMTKPMSQRTLEQTLREDESNDQKTCEYMADSTVEKEVTAPSKMMLVADAKKDRDVSKQELNGQNVSDSKSSNVNHQPKASAQKRNNSEKINNEPPKMPSHVPKQPSQGNPRESDKIFSVSSSCESFSTACCSSTSSSSNQSDSEQSEDQTSSLTGHDHQEINKWETSPTFASTPQKELTPMSASVHPSPLSSDSQDCQNACLKQPICHKSETPVSNDAINASDESRTTETETKFSAWLRSALKAWLPVQSLPTSQVNSEQKTARSDSAGHFHEYDVRNIINHRQTGLWDSKQPVIGNKTCPHSCVSSLCNFRQTLESWKTELKALHDALEQSSKSMSANQCSFCHKDHHCQGLTHCYTRQIAQEFWRTIIELKQSHLQSCNCPHVNYRKHGTPRRDANCSETEKCSLGHWHSCRSDFLGCSQQRNSSLIDEKCEAPCVHVLLNELDLLQKKLQELKQMKSSTKSRSKQVNDTSDEASCQTVKANQCSENDSQSNDGSNGSELSPTHSVSLTEELEELTEFFLGEEGKQSSDHRSIKKRKKQHKTSPEGGQMSPTNSLAEHAKPRAPPLLASKTLSPEQKTADIKDTHGASRTKMLGKFALRYLEHIENSLDTPHAFPFSCQSAYLPPACDGDSPRPLPGMTIGTSGPLLQSYSVGNSQCITGSENQKRSESVPPMYNNECLEQPISLQGSTEHFQERKPPVTVTGKCTEVLNQEQKNVNLKSAFDSIIADLIQFQQNHSKERPETNTLPEKSAKNVKFSPSSTLKSDSLTSASSAGDSLPAPQCVVPSNSTCSSLAPCEDGMKDVGITQAFDQLDKIVDELLLLMDSAPEHCTQ